MTTKPRINPWIIVWLCFATLSIVMSARQSVSVMTDEWANTLGWSKTFIGSGQSVALIMVAIFSPVAGNLAVLPLTGGTFPCGGVGMRSLPVSTAFLALRLNGNLPARGHDG